MYGISIDWYSTISTQNVAFDVVMFIQIEFSVCYFTAITRIVADD